MCSIMSQIKNFKVDIPVLVDPIEMLEESLIIFCLIDFNILEKCIYETFKHCKYSGFYIGNIETLVQLGFYYWLGLT